MKWLVRMNALGNVKKPINCTHRVRRVNKTNEILIILHKTDWRVFFIGKSYTLEVARWWHWGWGSGLVCAEDDVGKMRPEADVGFRFDCGFAVLETTNGRATYSAGKEEESTNLRCRCLSTIHKNWTYITRTPSARSFPSSESAPSPCSNNSWSPSSKSKNLNPTISRGTVENDSTSSDWELEGVLQRTFSLRRQKQYLS